MRIVEDQPGGLKTETMLGFIYSALGLVPFDYHDATLDYIYKNVNTILLACEFLKMRDLPEQYQKAPTAGPLISRRLGVH
jgi:hypothetical protein